MAQQRSLVCKSVCPLACIVAVVPLVEVSVLSILSLRSCMGWMSLWGLVHFGVVGNVGLEGCLYLVVLEG
jgi:hypothetical protein